MLKNEWKSLLKSKIFLVVIVAIIAIPTIYTTLFLGSMWDPYGNVDKLPVAIVNLDQSVSYDGRQLQVGSDLVDQLKENDSLSFNFVDADTATRGLKNGTYYMVITIPNDFSQNASTLLDPVPEKMVLDCQTNPGTNYIASKMSESALEKIRATVSGEVTRTYTETVFNQISDVGAGIQEASDGAGQIYDGTTQLADGNRKITDNLKVLADSSLLFSEGSDTLSVGLITYTAGVASLNDGANQLDAGAADLLSGIQTADGGAASLHTGTSSLLEGSQTLRAGALTLNSGLLALNGQVPALAEGVSTLNAGAVSLSAGTSSLQTASTVLKSGSSKLDTGMGSLKSGLTDLQEKTSNLPAASSVLDLGAGALRSGATDLKAGTETALSGAEQLEGGLNQLDQKSKPLTDGAAAIYTGLNQLVDSFGPSASGSADVLNIYSSLPDEADTLLRLIETDNRTPKPGVTVTATTGFEAQFEAAKAQGDWDQALAVLQNAADISRANEAAVQEANTQIAELNELVFADGNTISLVSSHLTEMTGAADALTQQTAGSSASDALEEQLTLLRDTSQKLLTGLNQYASGVGTLAGSSTSLTEGISSLNLGAAAMESGSSLLKAGTSELAGQAPALTGGIAGLNDGASELKLGTASLDSGLESFCAGISRVNDGASGLTAGTGELNTKVPALAEGVSRLLYGSTQLSAGADSLLTGAAALDSGTDTLKQGTTQLLQGAARLKDGSSSLAAGSGELSDNNATLLSGSAQLSEGASQISSGAAQLHDGSSQLKDGISRLADGSATLDAKLSDGAKQVSETTASDDTLDMFSAPVSSNETKITTVENNGHAMAPYMMSVALWVGCIAFCIMYPLMKYNGELKSGFSWWSSKASVLYLIAVIQALVMVGALNLLNGFRPAKMSRTLFVAVLASVAFMSILYFFNVCLGKVGSFLMLVFMVVQLAGSAGTYPVELSGAFVPKIHSWLPFTYTVNAFRSTISGGESIQTAVLVLLFLFLLFTALTLLVFQIRTRRIREGRRVMNELLEEKGLM